jgi:hypothetical protein
MNPAPSLSTTSSKEPVISETRSTLARNVLLAFLAACLVAVYARAAIGPLHMSTDAVDYFMRAGQLVHGKPVTDSQQPIGYPAALAALHFVGLGTIRGGIAVNFVALAIGCACSSELLR